MKKKIQSINENKLATDLTNDEGLAISISVAQVKEIILKS